MNLDEFLHKREADAGTFVTPAFRTFDPMEAFEHARKLFIGESRCRYPAPSSGPTILYAGAYLIPPSR